MSSPAKTERMLEPDLRSAVELVLQLMPIPGRSGEEGEVSQFVRRELLRAGAAASAIQTDSAHRRTPDGGQTGNLVFSLPGTVRGPRRMLSAHLDTVPICVGSRPLRQGDVVRSADPATGLGADDRAGVAVILHAALEILRHGLPHPPLTFCWFVQEETGLHGSRCLTARRLGKPAMAFNWDGGSPAKLTIGATGGYRLGIEIGGLASHAGNAPEYGVSAIAIAALAIADLHRGGWHGDVRKGRQRGTSNVGVIRGGDATNVVTDCVRIRAEARSHQPRFRQRIVAEIEKAFRRAAAEVRNAAGATGRVQIDGRLDYESFRLNEREPCVRLAADAVRAIGREPELAVTNGGLDANWLVKHGIPTVSLGCGQRQPHTTSETLSVPDFEDACRIALRLATTGQ
ncbi:MAG: M20/M25/M40 family metallo-hydrolase [Candidatus Anammoximicrobium sp.]|nr:M20/M25/M40 family metallo-hydrolase [Candidatus Anammoximicrobium sp.]